jgi:ATP-dependent Lon protease
MSGGEILFIEASRMPGSGNIGFTGQIGDVMRESGHAAFSLIRTRARKLRIKQETIQESDLHVHIPAGAVPKDGPSAGLAMVTAIISALKEQVVDPLTAMTGEITLRGAVLPVGGIKEKVLAAHRAGIRRVFLPAHNLKDLEEVPAEVRNDVTVVPVKTVDDVVPGVFQPVAPARKSAGGQRAQPRRKVAKRAAKHTPRKRQPTKSAVTARTTRRPKKKATARRAARRSS